MRVALGVGVFALVAVVLLTAGCGGGSSQVSASPGIVPAVRSALVERLHAKGLEYRWIACLQNGRSFRGHQIVRCNVNFGDPHVEAYCGVLIGGRLRTNHDEQAIACVSDRAGWKASITSS
jgi:hypothetical protein